MYLLNVNYTTQPENVMPHAKTHSDWVKKYIENGTFIFAGPKKSKLGGVILAKSMEKACLTKILNEDSYIINDVAEYNIIDFDCKLFMKDFQALCGY